MRSCLFWVSVANSRESAKITKHFSFLNLKMIKANDNVLLCLPSNEKRLIRVAGNQISLQKFGKITTKNLINKLFNQRYELLGDDIVRPKASLFESFDIVASNNNNMNLLDNQSSQKLTTKDIEELKEKGLDGSLSTESIIKSIIENSSTFESKTEFSKQKYIRRKATKFSKMIIPLAPTAFNLCEFFFETKPDKILNLRVDSLSALVSASNFHSNPNAKFLVFDDTQGLVLGALLEKTLGMNEILSIHQRDSENQKILEDFNFSLEQKKNIQYLPYKCIDQDLIDPDLSLLDSTDPEMIKRRERKETRFNQLKTSKQLLISGGFESLVISSEFTILPILVKLLPFMAGSASITIYSYNKEFLLPVFSFMRESAEFVNVSLNESFMREYQVDREGVSGTHPLMTMNGNGGFILTGIRVLKDLNPPVMEKKRRKN